MTSKLVIEEITSSGGSELARLVAGETLIGRDPRSGIRVENTAVSREHGVFIRIRNHWFYKDLGSTNGSWINAKPIKEGQIKLVRPGDVMQLADVPLRLKAQEDNLYAQPAAFAANTLIVFSGQEFLDEYPLPEYGRALVIGGKQADLKLDAHSSDLPRLVIERRGDLICAYGIADGLPVMLNAVEMRETTNLKDGDELVIGNYLVMLNDPRTPKAASPVEIQNIPARNDLTNDVASNSAYSPANAFGSSQAQDSSAGSFGNTFNKRSSSGRFTFGRAAVDDPDEEDVEGTMAMDPAEIEARLAGYDMHPSGRHRGGMPEQSFSFSSLEDRLVVFIGFVLLLILIILVIWWFFL